jgi:hypothetical protein
MNAGIAFEADRGLETYFCSQLLPRSRCGLIISIKQKEEEDEKTSLSWRVVRSARYVTTWQAQEVEMGGLVGVTVLFLVFILGFGLLSGLFGLANVIAYGFFLPLGLMIVFYLFRLLANSVKAVELESQGVEPEVPVDPKIKRVKLERLKARLEGHTTAESVKQELEQRKQNPPASVVPKPYKGGGTLPGAGGDPMYGND